MLNETNNLLPEHILCLSKSEARHIRAVLMALADRVSETQRLADSKPELVSTQDLLEAVDQIVTRLNQIAKQSDKTKMTRQQRALLADIYEDAEDYSQLYAWTLPDVEDNRRTLDALAKRKLIKWTNPK